MQLHRRAAPYYDEGDMRSGRTLDLVGQTLDLVR